MITFRVTKDEKVALQAQADAAGLKVGEYVRVKALGHDQDPSYVAAVANLSNHLSGVEDALATARALLSGNGAP